MAMVQSDVQEQFQFIFLPPFGNLSTSLSSISFRDNVVHDNAVDVDYFDFNIDDNVDDTNFYDVNNDTNVCVVDNDTKSCDITNDINVCVVDETGSVLKLTEFGFVAPWRSISSTFLFL